MTKTTITVKTTSTTGFDVSRANGTTFHVELRKNVMLAVLALFNQHAVEVSIVDLATGKETVVRKTKDGKFYYKTISAVESKGCVHCGANAVYVTEDKLCQSCITELEKEQRDCMLEEKARCLAVNTSMTRRG